MPTYDFKCPACDSRFSQFKAIRDYDGNASCICGHECDSSDRDFSRSKPVFIGTKVQSAEYNPGLGRVIHNKRELDYVCKSKNVVEVGNDYSTGESMQTGFEKRKQDELDKSWDI